jgi:glycosyltransferase involved in cell wall biosynthesis
VTRSAKQKVLLLQGSLEPAGGRAAVAAWMIEALKREYDLSVLTWSPPDVDRLNQFYGTSLGRSDFSAHWVPWPVRRLFELDPDPGSLQRLGLLMRVARMIKGKYDVLITASGEVDFGRRGIQYVYFPLLHPQYASWRSVRALPWHGRLWALVRGRYRPWMLLSGYSFDDMTKNLTLVVSEWTRRRFMASYGADATTVYPPVADGFPDVPWEQRENGFVCIGRISREKRLEQMIEILGEVRRHHQDTHLHIIGSARPPWSYYHDLRGRVQQHASWVFLHEHASHDEMTALVARHRYGIHAKPDEHFGIAVAEIAKAGCIVFAPNDGGQVEILGGDDRLLYGTAEDAVAKILRVMKDPGEQAALRRHLESRRHLFSTAEFVRHIQEIVRQFLASEGGG